MDEENNFMEDSSDEEFPCGDPKVEPRVGDEYQADIPPVMSASSRAEFLSTPVALDDPSSSFLVGRPVQVMWMDKHQKAPENRDEDVDMNESLQSLKDKRSRSSAKTVGESDKKQTLDLKAVPVIPTSSWEEMDEASFVLGLYAFGKDFPLVKEVMESKEVGEIILFYYGKFFNSTIYHSWCKVRRPGKKYTFGKKLYSGWRLQHIISRLMPSIPDDSQKQTLVNVSKSYAEGKLTLVKYICSVKDLVGLKSLIDAIALGKEDEDLTVLTVAPFKIKPYFTVSKPSLTPDSRAYNSLTSADIIKQLTGNSRLSKARCNDLFWEAVWPRLLGRGWHSEQPQDRGYVTAKDYIVFIVPGVKEFSRGELVKGEHYFDSVSDILTKVASEPELLEFGNGEDIKEAAASENSSDPSDEESSPADSKRQRYLQSPCSKNRGTAGMKFTVVDSSFPAGGKLCDSRSMDVEPLRLRVKDAAVLEKSQCIQNVEQTQVMPVDAKNQVDDDGTRERFTIVDTSLHHRGNSSGFKRWRRLPGDDTKSGSVGAGSAVKEEETLKNVKEAAKRSNKHKFMELNNGNSGPLVKQRRLNACVKSETRLSRESAGVNHLPGGDSERKVCPESDQLSSGSVQQQKDTHEEMNQENGRFEIVLSFDDMNSKTGTGPSSSLVETQETSEAEPNVLNSIADVDKYCSLEEVRPVRELISSKQEPNGFCSVADSEKGRPSNDLKQEQAVVLKSSPSRDQGAPQEVGSSEQQQFDQQTNTEGRRQSTRKRPLTTRALEALESSFYTTKRVKSTPKTRKRESSTPKKDSAQASTRSQSDNGNVDAEQRGEVTSKVARKRTTRKPVSSKNLTQIYEDVQPSSQNQVQDSNPVPTEHPKLPPIVLKLKRSSQGPSEN